MRKYILLCLLVLFIFSGCRFERIGNDLSKGISSNTESMGYNAVQGVKKSLADSVFEKRLMLLVDSMVTTAGYSANRTVKNLMDTLLSERWVEFTRQLIEEATGRKLQGNITALRNELLGTATNERIQVLLTTAMSTVFNDGLQIRLAALRDELLGINTLDNVSRIRDSLLGPKTNQAIRAIVDSAMMTFAYRMKNDINPSLQENLSFIQRNATTLLVVLGIIALVIIIVIWRLKEKYAKTTTVLASQINNIPDVRTYDELTNRIKTKAIETGVEPTLRKVLEDNGLLGKENWNTQLMKQKSLGTQ